MRRPVQIELTADEALILFDWLGKQDPQRLPCDDAERQVLANVEASLERVLVPPFAANYEAQVEDARRRILER